MCILILTHLLLLYVCVYTCTDQGTHATSADHPKYAASNTTLNKELEKEEVSDHPYTRYSDIHLSHGFVYDTIHTTTSSSTSTSSKHTDNNNDTNNNDNISDNSSDDDNDDIRKSLESIKQSFRTLNTTSNYNINNNPFYISPTHTDHPNYSFFTQISGSGPGSPTAHVPRHGLEFDQDGGHNSDLYGDDDDDEGEEEDNSIESLTKGLQNYDYFINNPVITSGHNSDLDSTYNNSNRISYADKMRLRAAAERKMFDDVAGQGEIAGQGVRSEVRTDDDPTAEQTIYSY